MHHAADQIALEGVETGLLGVQRKAVFQAFARDKALLGGAGEQVIEIRVRPGHKAVTQAVGDIDVQERHIEVERRHRQQHLAIGVGRLDGLECRVQARHVGGQAATGGQERQTHAGGAQAPLEHAFVELHQLQLAGFAGLAVVGFQRNGIEGGEAEHQFFDLAGGAQHAHFRTAVGDHGQVLHR
ncbi:hypothetical protein D3C76_1253020 [compost metagenome]